MSDVAEIAKRLDAGHRRLLGREIFVAYEGDWMSAFDLRDMGLATTEPGISRLGIHIAPTELGLAVGTHLESTHQPGDPRDQ